MFAFKVIVLLLLIFNSSSFSFLDDGVNDDDDDDDDDEFEDLVLFKLFTFVFEMIVESVFRSLGFFLIVLFFEKLKYFFLKHKINLYYWN